MPVTRPSRLGLETKLRLMCAVRTAVARAFDAKLVVGLGGRCCNKIRAGNSGTAAGMRAPDVSHGMHAACRTAVSHDPFLPHVPRLGAGSGYIVGRVGRKEGRATLSACKRAASAHAPPSAPTCARACAPACLRACMRALLRRKMRVLRRLSSPRPTWAEVVCACGCVMPVGWWVHV